MRPLLRGDCNGDGRVDGADIAALVQEMLDSNPQPAINAQNGAFPGSWGCGVHADRVIDSSDLAALIALFRSLAVRNGH